MKSAPLLPHQSDWPALRGYWRKLGTVRKKRGIVRCDRTAPTAFLNQSNTNYVESVVTPLIKANLFSAMLLTRLVLIMHFTSSRSCSTVYDVTGFMSSYLEIPGVPNAALQLVEITELPHPRAPTQKMAPKSKVRRSSQQGWRAAANRGAGATQRACFCRCASTMTLPEKGKRKFCINLFHLLHYVVSL